MRKIKRKQLEIFLTPKESIYNKDYQSYLGKLEKKDINEIFDVFDLVKSFW